MQSQKYISGGLPARGRDSGPYDTHVADRAEPVVGGLEEVLVSLKVRQSFVAEDRSLTG